MANALRGFAIAASAAISGTPTLDSGVFDVEPVTGDTIVALVFYTRDTSENITGVSDTALNDYDPIGTFSLGGGLEGRMFIAHNITGTLGLTCLATWDATGSVTVFFAVVAISGAHASAANDVADDATQTNPGITTDALTTGNLGTPSEAGEFVLAASYSGSGQDDIAPGTGWTELDDFNAGNIHGLVQYQIQGAAAPVIGTWTLNDDDGVGTFGMFAVSLKAAGGGGGGKVSKNTRAFPLGLDVGMNWQGQ